MWMWTCISTKLPDPIVDDAKSQGFDMPFFRDENGKCYHTSSEVKDGDGDANIGGDVQP